MHRDYLLPFLSATLLVVVMGLLSVHTLTSVYQDIGRHITLGRIIWQTHAVPSTNLFSYTARDFPFIDHHWFSEVLLYLGDRAVGLAGLILVKAVLVAAAFALALAAAWRARIALPALAVGVLSALIMVERTDVRPEILSFVFLGWFLFVLYRKGNLFWTLPLVQLFWVNSHIYFFMGPFLWAVYLICRWQVPSRREWLITGLIALATLANPWGLAGALYPFRIFSNYGYSIVENKSPSFLAAFGYPQMTSIAVYLGIVLTAVSFGVNWLNIRANAFGLIIVTATAMMALVMVRNFPLFALVMLPVVLKNLDEISWHPQSRQALGAGVFVVALFGVSVVTGQVYRDADIGRHFGLEVPAGLEQPLEFFHRNGLKGPIFNNFDIGSFLIWKLPEEPVFIDGRPEAYPADFIQNVYIRMQEDQATWERYRALYGLHTIIWDYSDMTPWSRTFVARITADPAWTLVYRDVSVMILVAK